MARIKISEYKAKQLLSELSASLREGIRYKTSDDVASIIERLDKKQRFVMKVDQGVKGRFKKGLVAVDIEPHQISSYLSKWQKQGYSQFFIEPFVQHDRHSEQY